jgi:hypothetical protein
MGTGSRTSSQIARRSVGMRSQVVSKSWKRQGLTLSGMNRENNVTQAPEHIVTSGSEHPQRLPDGQAFRTGGVRRPWTPPPAGIHEGHHLH